ncbi:MAG: NAD(P)-dependent oxidoreductase [Muribaculaceae bacterium]|nr:NAD(P)-dependent oxidoreductase [Muribaculaceae bacterium]MDE6461178.1 NAD(P)-dependent oxidoreductase [Muribaculaceae bacterium]
MMESRPRLLIVGAGGFIGGFIAAEALRRGFDTTVAVRASTSRSRLTDPSLKFLVLDYDDPAQMADAIAEHHRWDYVIYNLGATKCANFRDFNRINFEYLRSFATLLRESGRTPEKFIYMSSLSAVGPGDEKGYAPITEQSLPCPDTRYGLSKIKAEQWLEISSGVPWIILRPTGVYGPHEQDYLMMIKSIDSHFDFGVGFRKQMLTFIYVEDLVEAMFAALDKAPVKRRYNISEPRAYTQAEFRAIVARLLGRKLVVPLRLPLWMVYVASAVAEKIAALRGKPSTLNRDKYNIMRQRNWTCSTEAATEDFGFVARTSLEDGLRKTIDAYRALK